MFKANFKGLEICTLNPHAISRKSSQESTNIGSKEDCTNIVRFDIQIS